jgi:putative ABC transport system permease protein
MSADAAYRLLLRALPADLRREFGDDMVQLFRDQRHAVRGRLVAVPRLWLAAVVDVAREALASRTAARREGVPLWRPLMRASALDIRHGLRLLRRYPGSSALAVATLALGIGANTAIFSVVDTVLIRQLPYPEPDRLVMLWEKRPAEGVMTNVVSPADYLDWRRMQTSFEHVAALGGATASLTGDGEPAELSAAVVGWSFFDLLRVRMHHGRSFQPSNEVLGDHRVVILSHRLWQQRYGGDPGVIGRRVTLNGNSGWEVIGVLPPDFQFIDEYDLWAPLVFDLSAGPPPRVSHQFDVYARLRPEVTFAQALDEMDRIGKHLEALYPDQSRGHGAHVQPMRERYVGAIRDRLVILLSAVGFVLLIACVNTASLLLARAAARRREMAVRAALGASRGRLIVQTLSESVTLAAVGGLAGLAVAKLMLSALPLIMPDRLSVVGIADIGLDPRVLLFALGLSAVTGVVFGLLPAIGASRPDVADALNAGGRGAAGVRKGASRTLVIAEVALASLTLVGAGLVVRSFTTMLAEPLGFDAANRLTVTVRVPSARYDTPQKRRAALVEIERRLGALSGVASVGAANILPLTGADSRAGVVIEDREVGENDPPTRMHPRIVTDGYFRSMGIPIVSGRGFGPEDHDGSMPVVVVSETSARRYWPGLDPVGRRMRFTGDENWRTVIGVAGDVRHWGRSRPVNPVLYWPQAQAGSSLLTFVLAARADAAGLVPAVRRTIADFDAHLPLSAVQTMDEIEAASVRTERAQSILMGSFGAVALILAVIGIYGVTAQLVATRRHEIGVRMTLGARPRDILRHLLGEGLWQSLAGLAIGVTAGVVLMRLGATMLYGVQPWDPMTLASISVLLLTATLVAVLIPARRATRVDPASTLRTT